MASSVTDSPTQNAISLIEDTERVKRKHATHSGARHSDQTSPDLTSVLRHTAKDRRGSMSIIKSGTKNPAQTFGAVVLTLNATGCAL
jgi:hypothetical protein